MDLHHFQNKRSIYTYIYQPPLDDAGNTCSFPLFCIFREKENEQREKGKTRARSGRYRSDFTDRLNGKTNSVKLRFSIVRTPLGITFSRPGTSFSTAHYPFLFPRGHESFGQSLHNALDREKLIGLEICRVKTRPTITEFLVVFRDCNDLEYTCHVEKNSLLLFIVKFR